MSERGQVGFLGNLMGLIFVIPALMFGWKVWQATHPPAPSIPVDYTDNAIPMTWVDDCGEAERCRWWWEYDTGTVESPMPGWLLHFGVTMPPGGRPARSLPALEIQP